MAEEELTAAEALIELRELLRLAASEESLQRLAATRYTVCRDLLLQSELRTSLPGFLQQCLTIFRFRDFIHLYTPRPGERDEFVDEAIRACESRLGIRPTFDVFGEREF